MVVPILASRPAPLYRIDGAKSEAKHWPPGGWGGMMPAVLTLWWVGSTRSLAFSSKPSSLSVPKTAHRLPVRSGTVFWSGDGEGHADRH